MFTAARNSSSDCDKEVSISGDVARRPRQCRLTLSANTLLQLWQTISRIFFTFLMKPGVEDRLCQLDVTKVAGTLGHVLGARHAPELPINRAETRVVETPPRAVSCASRPSSQGI